MWKLGRKKSASETDERTFPAEKEFWLVRGAFREWQADRSGQGYYGLCDCWAEAVCPPGERSCQDRFYRLVYGCCKARPRWCSSRIFPVQMSGRGRKRASSSWRWTAAARFWKKWASGRTAVRSCFLKCRVRSYGTFTGGWRSMGAERKFTHSTACWSMWPRRMRPSPHSKKRRA